MGHDVHCALVTSSAVRAGRACPRSADDVVFDGNSGSSCMVTPNDLSGAVACRDLTFVAGFDGTWFSRDMVAAWWSTVTATTASRGAGSARGECRIQVDGSPAR